MSGFSESKFELLGQEGPFIWSLESAQSVRHRLLYVGEFNERCCLPEVLAFCHEAQVSVDVVGTGGDEDQAFHFRRMLKIGCGMQDDSYHGVIDCDTLVPLLMRAHACIIDEVNDRYLRSWLATDFRPRVIRRELPFADLNFADSRVSARENRDSWRNHLSSFARDQVRGHAHQHVDVQWLRQIVVEACCQ